MLLQSMPTYCEYMQVVPGGGLTGLTTLQYEAEARALFTQQGLQCHTLQFEAPMGQRSNDNAQNVPLDQLQVLAVAPSLLGIATKPSSLQVSLRASAMRRTRSSCIGVLLEKLSWKMVKHSFLSLRFLLHGGIGRTTSILSLLKSGKCVILRLGNRCKQALWSADGTGQC